jgi:hypothetical protein
LQQALDRLLQLISSATDSSALALTEALPAVVTKLTEAQAQQVLAPLLQQIGKTSDSDALQALAEAIRALPAKLSEGARPAAAADRRCDRSRGAPGAGQGGSERWRRS